MKRSPQETLYLWLESREELLWTGHPDPLRMARARIGLALAGLAVVLMLAFTPLRQCFTPPAPDAGEALSYSHGEIHLIEALPVSMFLSALFLMLQPFAAYYYAGRTTYAVTGKRLIMLRNDMFGTLVKTARLEAIDTPVLDLRSGGTGDIFFSRKADISERGRGPSPLTRFLGVPEAERIHQLIQSRLSVMADRKAPGEPVKDYLELLAQGKRRLDDMNDR